MKKSSLLLLSMAFLLVFATPAKAEYRAYLLEIFDHIQQKKWEAQTGFDPQKYVTMHGGGNRLTVIIKATWVCWGETSRFKPACEMPKPRKPKFKIGQRVKITLDKHMTQGWEGLVEVALWRQDLKSNVYGIRFGDKKQMYGRYYEFNLVLADPPPVKPTEAEKEAAAAAAEAAQGTALPEQRTSGSLGTTPPLFN